MASSREHRQRDVAVMSSDEEYSNSTTEQQQQLRRGPWTVEEDVLLVNYIAAHGEGRWNALARCSGLRRTGKSCRLRWLNYLRPDLRRGNMTAQEQLLILELHARWGNRWSKIAQHLPGRTDNEIKNYWRTRVQKHARQLNCNVNSQRFKDLMRYLWMPRLIERIGGSSPAGSGDELMSASSSASTTDGTQQQLAVPIPPPPPPPPPAVASAEQQSAPYSNDDTTTASAMWMWDTLCQQPPQLQQVDCYQHQTTTTTTTTCSSWSDESLLAGLSSATTGAVYADDMGIGLGVPELGVGDTMWGADDLWYTQIMGL